jgi:hypothetical protein
VHLVGFIIRKLERIFVAGKNDKCKCANSREAISEIQLAHNVPNDGLLGKQ